MKALTKGFVLALLLTLIPTAEAAKFSGSQLVENVAETTTAAGTTTLTLASARHEHFLGTLTQTVVLPNATTLKPGMSFMLENDSTGAVTVQYNGGVTAATLGTGDFVNAVLMTNATAAGTWEINKVTQGGVNVTANRALISSGAGAVTASAVTNLELANLSGTTSSLCGINQSCAITNKTIAFGSNTFTGTLPASNLPNPSATTLGGIESAAAVSNQWIDSISTLGVPHLSQPGFSNLTGQASLTTQVSGLLPVTSGGTNASAFAVSQPILSNSLGTTLATNGNFYWDDTNKRLGIGNGSSATQSIDVSGVARLRGLTVAGPVQTDASGNISSSATLPIASGGTGQATKTAAFDALSPNSTKADITVHNGTNNVRLPVGTNGQVLTADSTQVTGVKWAAAGASSFTALTVQKFTSASGTYTTPAGVLYIRVRMVGGGGGGSGSGTASGTAAGNGTASTFGTTLLSAGGGTAGAWAGAGGAGGTASLGTGPVGLALTGGYGFSTTGAATGSGQWAGGAGGSSPLFGGGGYGGTPSGSAPVTGGAAVANTGGGGGGGGIGSTSSLFAGTGGGSGAYVDAIITSPSATYSYAVGAGGSAGAAGTSGAAGGAGGSGLILVEEHYQ